MIMTDPLLFLMHFWKADTTVPESRLDLPEEWRGSQVITLEQRKMCLSGFPYMTMYDRYPEFCSRSAQRVLARTSRKSGKTLILFESRYVFLAINAVVQSGEVREGLIHAPAENQIQPVLARVDSKVERTPLFRMLHGTLNRERGTDDWFTGFRWHRRIEGPPAVGGKNMVGLRGVVALGDEGDYAGKAAYEERRQTLLPQAFETWGGVPREGVDSHFRTVARSPASPWVKCMQGDWDKPFRWDVRANPLYHSNEAIKNEKGQDGWDNGRVKTQVLGLDGGEGVSVFPVVETVSAPWFRYIQMTIYDWDSTPDAVFQQLAIDDLLVALDGDEPEAWMIHCDYGYDPSPMVVGISFLVKSNWYEFARISATRMHSPAAAKMLNALDLYLPKRPLLIVFDAHGRGAGTYEILREGEEYAKYGYADTVISPEFHTVVDDDRVMVHAKCKNSVKRRFTEYGPAWFCEACQKALTQDEVMPTRVRSKQFYTTELADGFRIANQRFRGDELAPEVYGIVLAAEDHELVSELVGTRGMATGTGGTQLKLFPPLGDDVDHNTDAWRCLARGIYWLRVMGAKQSEKEELDDFGFFDTSPESRRFRLRAGSSAHPALLPAR